MPITGEDGPGQHQIQSKSPIWVTGVQVLEQSLLVLGICINIRIKLEVQLEPWNSDMVLKYTR